MNRKSLPFVFAIFLLAVSVPVAGAQDAPATPPSRPAPTVAPAAPSAPSPSARVVAPPAAPSAARAVTPAPRAVAAPQTPPAPASPQSPPAPPQARSYFFTTDNFLGVYTEEVTRENMSRFGLREPRGVGVTRVVADGPAARAGLRENDVIVRFDGESVASVRKLNRLVDEAASGHTARLTVLRGGSEQELSVRLGSRRDFPRVMRGEALPRAQADELRRMGEEWGRRGEEMRRQGDAARRRADELRRARPNVIVPALGMRRRIGVSTTRLTDQLADYFGVERGRGLLVTSVAEGSAAAKAGIKAGDVITEADGERVSEAGDLSRVVNRRNEGEMTLTVVRDRQRRTVRLTPERVESPRFEMFMDDFGGAGFDFDFDGPSFAIQLPSIELPHIELPRIEIPEFRLPHPEVKITPLVIQTPRIEVRPFRLLGDGVLM